jgi:CheY-like chemotaxis protein
MVCEPCHKERPESQDWGSSLAIRVAEDNLSNQKVIVTMLKRLGYRPDVVADGKEVLQALDLRSYDLILMDVRMPEMDGITATRVIRKLHPKKGPEPKWVVNVRA